MSTTDTIDALNSLIVINNDRIEGYETARDETEEQDLKELFGKFAGTSRQAKQELVAEVTKLGGTPSEGTRVDGKFFRMWMDVKAAITGKDRKAILSSCEFGEDVALKTYSTTIIENTADLSPEQLSMLTKHQTLIRADHDRVKAMRDSLVEHE